MHDLDFSRGGAEGVSIFTPNEETREPGMYLRDHLQNRICVAMGSIAEEMVNEKNKFTTGASNDFQHASVTTQMMVEQMGKSE